MRLLKVLLVLLIVLALAVLLNNNSDQLITLWLFPGTLLEDINLATTLVATLGIGILVGFAIGIIHIMSQQRELRQQKRQLKKLRTEINALRHSALEKDVFKEGQPDSLESEETTPAAGTSLAKVES